MRQSIRRVMSIILAAAIMFSGADTVRAVESGTGYAENEACVGETNSVFSPRLQDNSGADSISDDYEVSDLENHNDHYKERNESISAANATDDYEIIKSGEKIGAGKCGDYLNWTLTADIILVEKTYKRLNLFLKISGIGEMDDYSSKTPWVEAVKAYREDNDYIINKCEVYFENGITKVGSNAFSSSIDYSFARISTIVFPSSVKNIGGLAFHGSGIESIMFNGAIESIGGQAFSYCSNLKKLQFPEEVGNIGYMCFNHCSKLEEVIFNKAVTKFDSYAFQFCHSLSRVSIAAGTKEIGDYAFRECDMLTSVKLGEGLEKIGNDSFSGCEKLSDIDIPLTVTNIGSQAFCRCNFTNIEIPSKVTTIGSYAFTGCESLVCCKIPTGVTSLEGTFSGCKNLETIELHNGITSIGAYTFSNCSKLKTITLPSKLKYVGSAAFYGMSIESFELPVSLETIGDSAFSYNEMLKSIYIPQNVTKIGGSIVSDCISLSSIVVDVSNKKYDSRNSCNAIIEKESGSLIAGCRTSVIPNSITQIADFAFWNSGSWECEGPEKIVIPDNVISVGINAFGGCTNLKYVELSRNLETIGNGAFSRCSIAKIVIPEKVTYLDGWTFSSCKNLRAVFIPHSVSKIGFGAFNASGITDVFYGGSQTEWSSISIGDSNDCLKNALFHYNAMPSDVYDYDAGLPIEAEKYIFTDTIIINGKGSAYVKIFLFNAAGELLKNTSIQYSVDGGKDCKLARSDENGVIQLTTKIYENTGSSPFTENVKILLQPVDGTTELFQDEIELKLSINPLSYKESFKQETDTNIDWVTGVGAGATIGPVDAGVYAGAGIGVGQGNLMKCELDVDGNSGNKRMLLKDGVNDNVHSSSEAKIGAALGNPKKDEVRKKIEKGKYELTMIDAGLSGKVALNTEKGIDIKNIDGMSTKERHKMELMLVDHILTSRSCSAFVYEGLRYAFGDSDDYSYEMDGISATLGSNIDATEIQMGDKSSFTLGGIGADCGVSSAHSIDDSRNSESVSSTIVADTEVSLCKLSAKTANTGAKLKYGLEASVENVAQISVTKALKGGGGFRSVGAGGGEFGSDQTEVLKLKSAITKDMGYSFLDKTQTSYIEYSIKDDHARNIIDSNEDLLKMESMKIAFPGIETYKYAFDEAINPGNHATISQIREDKTGISFPIRLVAALGEGVDLGIDISGERKLEYDQRTENPLYNGNDELVGIYGSILDIQGMVESQPNGIIQVMTEVKESIERDFAETVKKVSVAVTDAIKDSFCMVVDFGKKAGNVSVNIYSYVTGGSSASNCGGLKLVSYDSEQLAVLGSGMGLVTTVGEPYYLTLSENGTETTELKGNPITIRLLWTNEMLEAIGLQESYAEKIGLYRFDKEYGTYIHIDGINNVSERYVEASVNELGEFVLAVDSIAPNVTFIDVEANSTTPHISICFDDETGISSANLKIDEQEYLDDTSSPSFINGSLLEYTIPEDMPLSYGAHVLYVTAMDTTGNRMELPASYEFEISSPYNEETEPDGSTICIEASVDSLNVSLLPGETRRLSVSPTGRYIYGVKWDVSFPDAASKNCISVKNGVVTAKKAGTAKVTASYGSSKVEFYITVDGSAPKGKTVSDGKKTYKLTAPKTVNAKVGEKKKVNIGIPANMRNGNADISVEAVGVSPAGSSGSTSEGVEEDSCESYPAEHSVLIDDYRDSSTGEPPIAFDGEIWASGSVDEEQALLPAKANGLNVETHTPQEIKEFIKSHPSDEEEISTWSETPSSKYPYVLGKISDTTRTSALNMLNTVRYIAGLNADVTSDDEYEKLAQAATLADAAFGMLSHYPEKVDDMDQDLYDLGARGASSCNLGWSYSSSGPDPMLNNTILHGWTGDSDSSNIDVVGHRRWVLSPWMSKTGFGVTIGPYKPADYDESVYTAMYAFDTDDKKFEDVSELLVAWPAQNTPVEYFSEEWYVNYASAWSLSTGRNQDIDKVKVTLVRRSDNKTWSFSKEKADGFFNVDNNNYGQPGCVIFRPDGISRFKAGEVFDVSISGLNPSDVSYTVNFFSAASTQPVTGVSLPSQQSVKVGKTITLTPVISPSNATNNAVTWKSGDNSIATVDDNGKVTGVKAGSTTITVTTLDGGHQAVCALTVEESTEPGPVDIHKPSTSSEGVSTWDCIWFGNYWQEDTNGDGYCFEKETVVSKNGAGNLVDQDGTRIYDTIPEGTYEADSKQPIKWRVLDIDDSGNALLLADKLIDTVEYHDTNTNVTWETCTVRSYLNGYDGSNNVCNKDFSINFGNRSFIYSAFNDAEINYLKKSEVKNPDNLVYGTKGGNTTYDWLFCLSLEEAMNGDYGFIKNEFTLPSDEEKKYYTDYDSSRVAVTTKYTDDKPGYTTNTAGKSSWWWLRSPGSYSSDVSYVNYGGEADAGSCNVDSICSCLRPAFRMNLSSSSSLWSYAGTVSSDGTVVEPKAVTGVTLSKTANVEVGKTITLTPVISPSNATNQKVTWKSSVPSVTSVSTVGTVTGIKAGMSVITVTTNDGGYEASCTVTVTDNSSTEVKVTGVELYPTQKTIAAGKTTKLGPIIKPSNATNQKVTWRSSVPSVASVSTDGTVTGIKAGMSMITVTTNDGGYEASCTVTVTDNSSTEVKVNGVELYPLQKTVAAGKTTKLSPIIKPSNATNQKVTWKSSVPSVASVSTDGTVTGIKAGTTRVTVTTDDGGFEAYCDITVKETANNLTTENLKIKWLGYNNYDRTKATKGFFEIEALDVGTTYVVWTMSDENGKEVSAVTKVIVKKPITELHIAEKESSPLTLNAGEGKRLTVTGTKGNTDPKDLSFSVKGKGVKVSKSGYVVATTPGSEATVTVKVGNVSDSIRVSVPSAGRYLSLNKTTVNIKIPKSTATKNSTVALKLTTPKKKEAQPNVTWSIAGDPEGITVFNGVVSVGSYARPGCYVVKASADGYNTACCELIVR